MFSGHTLYDVEEALAKNKGGTLSVSNSWPWANIARVQFQGKAPTTNNGVGTLVKAVAQNLDSRDRVHLSK